MAWWDMSGFNVINQQVRDVAAGYTMASIADYDGDGLADILDRTRIVLLDDLEIDFETHEYRMNGGEWFCALSADCDGVSVDYPTTVGLPDEELGGLRPIIRGISAETGIEITVERIDYR